MKQNNKSLFLTYPKWMSWQEADTDSGGDWGSQTVFILGLCHFQPMAPKVIVLIWIAPAKKGKNVETQEWQIFFPLVV